MPRYRVTIPVFTRMEEIHYVDATTEEEAKIEARTREPDDTVEDVDFYEPSFEDSRVEEVEEGGDCPPVDKGIGCLVATIFQYISTVDDVEVIDITTENGPENEKGPLLRVYLNEASLFENPAFPEEEE
jgi:hypothetical protein